MLDDIHPEELLVTRRVLTDDERADLRAHLARCPGCALQVALRADVARAFEPTDVDYEVGARAVARVLASARWAPPRARVLASRARAPRACAASPPARPSCSSSCSGRASRRRRSCSGTRGRLWNVTKSRRAERGRRGDLSVSPPASPFAGRARGAAPLYAEAGLTDRGSPPVVAPGRRARHDDGARDRGRRAARRRRPRATFAPEREAGAPSAPLAPPGAGRAVRRARDADDGRGRRECRAARRARLDRLRRRRARATRRRTRSRHERLYGRLAADFSGSREELIARVLRGQTLLDNLGHPGLRRIWRRSSAICATNRTAPSRRRRAPVAPQALWHLGRPAEEAAAWNELLTLHPHSLHAALARSRSRRARQSQ